MVLRTELEAGAVVVAPAELASVMSGPNGLVFRYMTQVGDEVKRVAKDRVGYATGELHDSIVKRIVKQGDRIFIIVAAEAEHAELHHEGTEPHVIEGNPVLSFVWKGEQVFFTRVNHPGTDPNRFLTDAVDDVAKRRFML